MISSSVACVKSTTFFWQLPQNPPVAVGVNELHFSGHGMGTETETVLLMVHCFTEDAKSHEFPYSVLKNCCAQQYRSAAVSIILRHVC